MLDRRFEFGLATEPVVSDIPLIITSLDQLKGRTVRPHFYPNEPHTHSVDTLAMLLRDMDLGLRKVFPNADLRIPIKAYLDVPHGIDPPVLKGFARTIDWFAGLQSLHDEAVKKLGGPSSCGFGSEIQITCIHQVPTQAQFTLPMIDLEVDTTDDPKADLDPVVDKLTRDGVSGIFLRSGDIGRGSYHFIADFLMIGENSVWKFGGYCLTQLITNEGSYQAVRNYQLAIEFGQLLTKTESPATAKSIAQAMRNNVFFRLYHRGKSDQGY
ncbi:hypothetical protein A2691_03890 [Candidatus Woesebacteria bacterium RIFCSPHIGHO2_01_FULL_39_23]|nr:MAG: hypothetical protein A2691_03890 [Candidatus Woesebacteria bacterium RIFCSPHIGHO2_01_FULL_39_23]